MKLGSVPQAFPYQGSKRKLASTIIQCVPKGTSRLVEPFAGSAAISVAAVASGRTKKVWLNDAHKPLADLWTAIVTDTNALCDSYEQIWTDQEGRSAEHYNEIRAQFNSKPQPDKFLFLLARCVKAAIRYNRNGDFNNSPDHRRKGMRPAMMRRNLLSIAELLGPKTKVTNLDYRDVLSKLRPSDVVYMDPPYQGVCKDRDSRYANGISYDDFVEALEELNGRNIPYIVSYDGRTGDKEYGKKLPEHLKLMHAEIAAGKSTQATLLGSQAETFEALYLSKDLIDDLDHLPDEISGYCRSVQPSLFE